MEQKLTKNVRKHYRTSKNVLNNTKHQGSFFGELYVKAWGAETVDNDQNVMDDALDGDVGDDDQEEEEDLH